MGGETKQLTGPDLSQGVRPDELRENEPLLGHAAGEALVLVRHGGEVFATAATCTHYGGPLAEGIVAGGAIHCPWHHACFDLRSGLARGPALSPLACFEVVTEGGLVKVGARREPKLAAPHASPASVVIVGAGAAGAACAETLRREGYAGKISLIGDELPGPVDRPNLSKDYLAGTAPEEWIPLRTPDFYAEQDVELLVGEPVVALDVEARNVRLKDGRAFGYGALLLATGAAPIVLDIPGSDAQNVLKLRTLADSRAIIARAAGAKRAVVVGASFIGLEVAASLRQRGIDVCVVAPEAFPLARVLGDEVGRFVQAVHEQHGTEFRLGRKPAAIRAAEVVLDDQSSVAADMVVIGVGVRPRSELAQAAGLKVENGVLVDERLRTSAPDVYAAGDVARFPYQGERVRIEHWAVAERQGRSAALCMLGHTAPFQDVPFFWSQHHDVTICYVGHAARYDAVEIKGDLSARDACIVYRSGGRVRAVATIGRDQLSLRCERALETNDVAALEALLKSA